MERSPGLRWWEVLQALGWEIRHVPFYSSRIAAMTTLRETFLPTIMDQPSHQEGNVFCMRL